MVDKLIENMEAHPSLAALAVLKSLEWAGDGCTCPICNASGSPHAKDCRLYRALAANHAMCDVTLAKRLHRAGYYKED